MLDEICVVLQKLPYLELQVRHQVNHVLYSTTLLQAPIIHVKNNESLSSCTFLHI